MVTFNHFTNQNSSTNTQTETAAEREERRELLKRTARELREQYREVMALNEELVFMIEVLGPASAEHVIHLSDSGVCGFRNILNHMKYRAENVACGGLYTHTLEKLSGLKLEDGWQDEH